MRTSRGRTLLVAGAATAMAIGVVVVPSAADAAAPKGIPVISAHLGNGVSLSRSHVRPGRVTFSVHSAKDHTLQIALLKNGYTLAQANQDIGAAFGGNVAAVRRVDKNVSFKGGVESNKGKPGRMTIYLSAGSYLAVNLDTGKARSLTVSGAAVRRKTVSTNSTITMLTYGFDTRPSIARSGEMRLSNVSDQPHFLVLQHVRRNTTRKQVAKAFSSNSNSTPKFLLKAGTSTGLLSPNKTQAFRYNLPAGRYVIACFWPDDDTGMSHASMGMFKLITLR